MWKKLLGILLILFGCIIFIGSLAAAQFRHNDFKEVWDFQDRKERTHRLFPVTGIEEIDLEGIVNIEIRSEKRKDIFFELQGSGANRLGIPVRKENKELQVHIKPRWDHWFDDIGEEMKLIVHLPQSYQGDLSIDAQAGNVTLLGLNKNHKLNLQELELELGAGNLELNHVKTKKLFVKNTAGNIIFKEVIAPLSQIEAFAGNVDLDHFSGAGRMELTAGKFTAQIDQLTGALQVENFAGNIALDLAEQENFKLEATTLSGNIKNSFPRAQITPHRWEHSGKLTIGKGQHLLRLNAHGGNIEIY